MADNNTPDDAERHTLRMPDCMMPDGAEPCSAYTQLYEMFLARDAALRDAREEIENLQANADMDGTMIRKLREQDARLRKQIAAERASIVALLRREAETGPVGAAAACRYCADLIERSEHVQPEPARREDGE